jgi:hypothetical protein
VARLKLRLHELFSPAGAGIILICFFLPWVRVSCGGKNVTLSGAKIGGIFWAIIALAGIMLTAYLYFKFQKSAHKSRFIFLVGAVISIGIIAYQTIKVMLFPDIPFYIPSALINFRIKPGAWGTLVGLILILASAPYIRTSHKDKSIQEKPDESA